MTAIEDPSLPLRAAFVAALKAADTAAGTRVYDAVPAAAKFPYIRIGNVQVLSENVECLQGAEVYVTVDVFSQATGKTEVHQIGKDIIAALDDADISSPALKVNSCLFEEANYLDDPDGKTSHGVFTFHILTD